ncbi:MAG: hypothetical protein NUV65_01645 [Candidatus Roizmanbacteria bacterium]|nr:hypothetical protein [Candidatus Roizmanbacteria bacterium]
MTSYTIFNEGPHPSLKHTADIGTQAVISNEFEIIHAKPMRDPIVSHYIEFMGNRPAQINMYGPQYVKLSFLEVDNLGAKSIVSPSLAMTPSVDTSLLRRPSKEERGAVTELVLACMQDGPVCKIEIDPTDEYADDYRLSLGYEGADNSIRQIFGMRSNPSSLEINSAIMGTSPTDLRSKQLQGSEIPYRCYNLEGEIVFEYLCRQLRDREKGFYYDAFYGVHIAHGALPNIFGGLPDIARRILDGTLPRRFDAISELLARPYIRIQVNY